MTRGRGLLRAVPDGQSWLGQTDALDLAGEQPRGGRVRAVEGELDAGGSAVDRQDDARLRLQPPCAGALWLATTAWACHALLISNAVRTAANSLRLAELTLG